MDGTYFLDFVPCQVTAGELVLISFALAFLYKLWAERNTLWDFLEWQTGYYQLSVSGCSRHLGFFGWLWVGCRVGGGMVSTYLGKRRLSEMRGESRERSAVLTYTISHIQKFNF